MSDGREAPHLPAPAQVAALLALSILIAAEAGARVEIPFCATKLQEEAFAPPTLGQTQVTLLVPPNVPVSSVTEAKGLWATSCPSATHLPSFSVVKATGPAQGHNRQTSIQFVFRPGLGPLKDGIRTIAEYEPDPGDNLLPAQIIVYGSDDNGPIDWTTPKAIRDLAHEIGHALGLGHDECGRDSLMRESDLLPTARIHPAHCWLTDFANCDPFSGDCPKDPTRPAGPLGDLPDQCIRLPSLCPRTGSGSGGGGGGEIAWWDYPETRPDLVCNSSFTLTCGNSGCTGTVTLHCRYQSAPTLVDLPANEFINMGPRIGVRAPLAYQVVSGTVPVSGWAVQELHGVQAMAMWLDGRPTDLGGFSYGLSADAACAGVADPHCPNVGFLGFLDTRQLPNGPHTLQIVAVDDRETFPTPTRLDVGFVVENCLDTQVPSVVLGSPPRDSVVSGTVMAQAAASDNGSIAKVELFVDGALKGIDAAAPFAYAWNTTEYGDGIHRLKARAHDACGNMAFSPEISVTVENDAAPPAVSLTAPAQNAVVTGMRTLQAQATDDVRVSRVEFYVDGLRIGTEQIAPYGMAWNSALVADGTHLLLAKAFDPSGNAGTSATVRVTTENVHPTVRLTAAAAPILPGDAYLYPSTPAGVAVSRLFTLWNDGNADLLLANPSTIVSGAGYSEIEAPPSTIPPGGSGSFRIRLHHGVAGVYTGTVRIESNEPSSPFVFQIRGTVGSAQAPRMRIAAPGGAAILPGSVFQFPGTPPGTPVSRLFTIWNDGEASLTLAKPAGLVAGAGWSEIEVPPAVIPPGGSGSFRIRLFHSTPGPYSGTVSVETNDPASPFQFTVRGAVEWSEAAAMSRRSPGRAFFE